MNLHYVVSQVAFILLLIHLLLLLLLLVGVVGRVMVDAGAGAGVDVGVSFDREDLQWLIARRSDCCCCCCRGGSEGSGMCLICFPIAAGGARAHTRTTGSYCSIGSGSSWIDSRRGDGM